MRVASGKQVKPRTPVSCAPRADASLSWMSLTTGATTWALCCRREQRCCRCVRVTSKGGGDYTDPALHDLLFHCNALLPFFSPVAQQLKQFDQATPLHRAAAAGHTKVCGRRKRCREKCARQVRPSACRSAQVNRCHRGADAVCGVKNVLCEYALSPSRAAHARS